ncbi:MAG: hypothetical protein OYM47_19955 [Gemmatimonadota bacterium]|nr:hypothetical protein [Gemmatimonadota bacterium]
MAQGRRTQGRMAWASGRIVRDVLSQHVPFQAASKQERLCCIFVQADSETLAVDLMLQ